MDFWSDRVAGNASPSLVVAVTQSDSPVAKSSWLAETFATPSQHATIFRNIFAKRHNMLAHFAAQTLSKLTTTYCALKQPHKMSGPKASFKHTLHINMLRAKGKRKACCGYKMIKRSCTRANSALPHTWDKEKLQNKSDATPSKLPKQSKPTATNFTLHGKAKCVTATLPVNPPRLHQNVSACWLLACCSGTRRNLSAKHKCLV